MFLSFSGALPCVLDRDQVVDSLWHVRPDPSRPDTTGLKAMGSLIDHFSADTDTGYQLAVMLEDLAR